MEKNVIFNGLENLLLHLCVYFEKRIVILSELPEKRTLAKERIRVVSRLCCNNPICVRV